MKIAVAAIGFRLSCGLSAARSNPQLQRGVTVRCASGFDLAEKIERSEKGRSILEMEASLSERNGREKRRVVEEKSEVD